MLALVKSEEQEFSPSDTSSPIAARARLESSATAVTAVNAARNSSMDNVTEKTCGICLEDSKDPLDLPCGHSFCDGCLNGWRSRYGVEEDMRRKCPVCRARIPPSKEMVSMLLTYRTKKQELEDDGDTSSDNYYVIEKGYKLGDKVIRYPKVVIGK